MGRRAPSPVTVGVPGQAQAGGVNRDALCCGRRRADGNSEPHPWASKDCNGLHSGHEATNGPISPFLAIGAACSGSVVLGKGAVS